MGNYLTNLVCFWQIADRYFPLCHYFSFVTYSFQRRYDIAVLVHTYRNQELFYSSIVMIYRCKQTASYV